MCEVRWGKGGFAVVEDGRKYIWGARYARLVLRE